MYYTMYVCYYLWSFHLPVNQCSLISNFASILYSLVFCLIVKGVYIWMFFFCFSPVPIKSSNYIRVCIYVKMVHGTLIIHEWFGCLIVYYCTYLCLYAHFSVCEAAYAENLNINNRYL